LTTDAVVMKTMGWSWEDYCATPLSVVNHVIDMIEREQREIEDGQKRRA